jgi:hypothetical protein
MQACNGCAVLDTLTAVHFCSDARPLLPDGDGTVKKTIAPDDKGSSRSSLSAAVPGWLGERCLMLSVDVMVRDARDRFQLDTGALALVTIITVFPGRKSMACRAHVRL